MELNIAAQNRMQEKRREEKRREEKRREERREEKRGKSTNVRDYTRKRSEDRAAYLNRTGHIILCPRYSPFTWQDKFIVMERSHVAVITDNNPSL
jgi:hypothetical protein